MRVLVTGAGGLVGSEVLRLGSRMGVEAVGLTRGALDITDRAAVRAAAEAFRPDAVVNAAAYTAVDRAEAEPGRAFAVNAAGARHVAEAARAVGAACVHLSTDYVFDGEREGPYAPDDERAPVNVYGASKADGEDQVLDVMPTAVVLRTAWIFGRVGEDFVTAMLRLAAERPRLRVVADQWGHPTPAHEVARAALLAAARAREGLAGRLHVAGAPLATWADLAEAVVEVGSAMKAIPSVPVERIPSSAYPTAARRPRRVALEMASSQSRLGSGPVDWRRGLEEVVAARARS